MTRTAAGRSRRKIGTDDGPSLLGDLIEAVVPHPRDPSRVRIKVQGRTIADLDELAAHRAGLRPGTVIDEALEAKLNEVRARDGARKAALRRIEHSGISASALEKLLVRKGAAVALAKSIVAEMAELGLIDDERYAAELARSLLVRAPAGSRLIEARLRAKGIAPELAKRAAKQATGDRDALEDATALARRRASRIKPSAEPEKARRRVLGALVRRGFDADVAFRALDAALGRARSGYR